MSAQPKQPGNAAGADVALADVLRAVADEISDMEQTGRTLESLVARLASPVLTEEGVIEGLQAMDQLNQRIGAMCSVLATLAATGAPLDEGILNEALDGINLEGVKEKLRQRIYGASTDGAADGSDEIEYF
ncbi:MAG: hypothetical protein PVI23_09650 [Maricaulaceae bacterium]|jgi:hypothetical protein